MIGNKNVSSLALSLARQCRITSSTKTSNSSSLSSKSSSWLNNKSGDLIQCRSISSSSMITKSSSEKLVTCNSNNNNNNNRNIINFKRSMSTIPKSISSLNSFISFQKSTNIINNINNNSILPIIHHQHYPIQQHTHQQQQTRTMATKKHKRIIKMAKGYRGRAKNTFRAAIRRVEKGLQYAYRDRKVKKRNFRKLWIERVNAGVRQHGMSYSRFINAMAKMNVDIDGGVSDDKEGNENGKKILLNRKVLADLAANEPFSFKAVVDVVKMCSNK